MIKNNKIATLEVVYGKCFPRVKNVLPLIPRNCKLDLAGSRHCYYFIEGG